jgi:iron complex transport system substrate-binding protein
MKRLANLVGLWAIVGLAAAADSPPARIVSLVPALTEILFAVGAGPRVVGVSSFDRLPPASVARVGGLVDPDVERVLSLKPDLAIVYGGQADLIAQLGRASIPLFEYRHADLAQVTATIRRLGTLVGRGAQAEDLAGRVDRGIEAVRRKVAGRPKPRTLLVFGRQPQSLRGIYASGGFGFLHDMLEAAGGENVFADVKRESVQVTTEMILARAPDVIVELRYGEGVVAANLEAERASWSTLSAVPAVRRGRIVLLVGDEFVVPGPRIVAATERLAAALHP